MPIYAKGHVPWLFGTIENSSCNSLDGMQGTYNNVWTGNGKTALVNNTIIPQSISYCSQYASLAVNTFSSSYPLCNNKPEFVGVAVVGTDGNMYLQAPKFHNWLDSYDYKPYTTIFNPISSWPILNGKIWKKED
jgi:hypothetical protein